MRFFVTEEVNSERTKILLDTEANISAISESFVRKIKLKSLMSTDKQIDVEGIERSKVGTTSRTSAKVTLAYKEVYEFEVWIMPHHAGVGLIFETEIMIPAGVRLDLLNATSKPPNEISIPLLGSARDIDETSYGNEVTGGPDSALNVESRSYEEFRLQRIQPR